MISLLTPEGLEALLPVVTPNTLFAFDLDGTLAPIVDDPQAVIVPETIRTSMIQLAARVPTAVITGRARGDALSRLGFTPRYLIGNHGNEGLPNKAAGITEEQLIKSWYRQLQALLPPPTRDEILFEDKGSSLALHYRHASDTSTVHAALLTAIAQLKPQPRRIGGVFVENLIPPWAPHKGDALLYLMDNAKSERAFFLGDDETDEDIFRLNDARIFSVCVGTGRPTAARYYLKNQSETANLLQMLLNVLV